MIQGGKNFLHICAAGLQFLETLGFALFLFCNVNKITACGRGVSRLPALAVCLGVFTLNIFAGVFCGGRRMLMYNITAGLINCNGRESPW